MGKNIADGILSEDILKALEGLGYQVLTSVQEKVIPLVLDSKDVIVRSQTGSGKTAAFAIPVCEKLEVNKKEPQALVLTPTRELAVQLKQEISNIGRFKKVRCAVVFGSQPMERQTRELKQRVHIIVGTPGRVFDHIEKGNINLESIKYLVIDEADKMLELGFIEQVEAIIKRLPINRVTLVLSATLPEEVQIICRNYMKNPVNVEVEQEDKAEITIKQEYYEAEDDAKFSLVTKLIYTEQPDSCIVFCNTRENVELLFQQMKRAGFSCIMLHGGMEQRDRLKAIQSFKRGEFQFLIATDVAARGIHVDDISIVINYDIPQDNESYVHRIGRTGRAGSHGKAITIATREDRKTLAEIEEYIQHKIARQEIPSSEEVEKGKTAFDNRVKPVVKSDINEELNRDITRIRINAGKKSKMRPGDIVGAVTNIEGIGAEDVGIIDIQDTCSYIEILGGKGDLVMRALENTRIKGKIHTIKQVGFHSI